MCIYATFDLAVVGRQKTCRRYRQPFTYAAVVSIHTLLSACCNSFMYVNYMPVTSMFLLQATKFDLQAVAELGDPQELSDTGYIT